MKKADEILEQYTEKEKIDEIIEIIKSKPIKKGGHFEDRIFERNIPKEIIDKNMYLFNKVRLVDKRKHRKGDIGYDLYYELDKYKTLKLAFIPKEDKILLANAFLRHMKWQGSVR